MLDFISAIPKEFSWGMVGFALAITVVVYGKLSKIIYMAIKMRLEDEREEEANV